MDHETETPAPGGAEQAPPESIPERIEIRDKAGSMARHMKFVGLFTVLYGIFISLSIIGAIIGIPLIISGLRLRESADYYQQFDSSNEDHYLGMAFDTQKKFFFITKLLIILAIIILLLYVGAVFFMFNELMDMMQSMQQSPGPMV